MTAADLEPPLDELAHHLVAVDPMGDAEKALGYLRAAAERAQSRFAYDESIRYYKTALDLLPRSDAAARARRRALLLALGDACRRAGATPEALAAFSEAAREARDAGSAADLARAALGFEDTTWRPGLSGKGDAALLREALQALGGSDLVLTARLLAGLARALIYAGEVEPGLTVMREAQEAARRTGDAQALAGALRAGLALDIGERLPGLDADGVYGLQMFTLHRLRGRLRRLEPVVRSFVRQPSGRSAWRPGLALLYSELGVESEARSFFEQLAADGFAGLPRDGLWLARP